jgi:UDP-N-acetyl-D-mannosaminuronic acid transferase (WecB/TagA/CpsF family)
VYNQADYPVSNSNILIFAYISLYLSLRKKIFSLGLFTTFYNDYGPHKNTQILLVVAVKHVAKIIQKKINNKVITEILITANALSFGFCKIQVENQQIVDMINQLGANILAIIANILKQEKWIIKCRGPFTSVKVFLSIVFPIDLEARKIQDWESRLNDIGLEGLDRMAIIATKTMEEIFFRYNFIPCFANTAETEIVQKSLVIKEYF